MNSHLSEGERYIRLQKVCKGSTWFFLRNFFFIMILFCTSYTFGQIKNNYIDYTNGLNGTICNGTSPGTIAGTTPTGLIGALLGYKCTWEKNTTGPSSAFDPIAGATSESYTPGNLSQTTWFRRKVSVLLLSDSYSNVLQVTVASQPSVSAVTTRTCVGGSTGTITATGSGGFSPYTFNLNSGTYQSSASFTGLASGTYTLGVKNSAGCMGSSSVTISSYPNSTDNQSATATDSWIGHVYSGMNFNSYIGHFTEPEMFDEGFGGDYNCFSVTSASTTSSIYTEQFSIRFRMNSTRKGLYIADLGSDDGSRLTVDGTVVYNNWSDQSFSNRNRVLMTLTGSSSLTYEFYENTVQNRLVFQNLTKILSNELTSNTTQSICLGNVGSAISGDAFGTPPPGISLSGTGYQWSYSTTPGGVKTDIAGATSATYIPPTSVAPFNAAGTYYIYRSAKLSSTNNTGVNPYVATNVSNAATITVNAIPSATISYAGSPFCSGSASAAVTRTGTSGGTFSSTPGLSIDAASGAIDLVASTPGNYTVTYTFFSSCTGYATTNITIKAIPASPVVTTPVNYCQNATALQLTAIGSNLIWGEGQATADSVGGSTPLTTPTWIDNAYSNKKTNFSITVANVKITSVDYYIPAHQKNISGLVLALYSSTGAVLDISSTTTTVNTEHSAAIKVRNQFNYIIATPGDYSIGAYAGSGTIGGDSPAFPITGAGGYITITGTNNAGLAPYHCFNNIQFTANNASVAPTPSTETTGTTNYIVSQTVNGCKSPQATISVVVNPNPAATISYADAPFCNTLSIAEPVTVSGTPGGQFTAVPSGLSVNATSGAIVPSGSLLGDYTITYTVASAGCPVFTTSSDVYVGAPGTWTGHADDDWNNASNWICGLIPGLSTDVVLSKAAANYPTVINGLGTVNNITLQNDAFLTVKGTLKIAGNIIDNDGAINAANGSIEMNGSSGQIISGNLFHKKTIKNLIVSNTGSGLSVSSAANDTLKISGTLSFGNSNSILNTGDNITLVSDSAGTANVGMVRTGNAINGKVIVERYINTGITAGQHAKSWQFLATPTNGQTIKESWMENGSLTATGYGTQVTGAGGTAAGFDLATATPSLKYYNPLTNSWVGVANTTEPIYSPKGYMVFVRGDRGVTVYNQPANTTTLRTKGALLTGSLSPISILPDKWESVGNPYASPIDFTLITKGAGVDDKFYVWDPYLYGSYGLGGYQTLSSINNWEPVPGGTVTYKTGAPYKTIQSGQAFFVHATSLGGGIPQDYTLTFTESCKAGSSSVRNFARHKDISIDQRQFFRTSLYTGADSNSVVADGNIVAFGENFDNDIDRDDAFKMTNSGENFGLKRNGKILSIEAKRPVTNIDTIYFNMGNLKQQMYQLRFAPQNMENSGLEAFLIDQFLNTTTPVRLTGKTVVDVLITGNTGSTAADRFKVVFKHVAPLTATFTSINAYEKANDIALGWSVKNESDMLKYEVEKSRDGKEFIQSVVVPATNQETGNYQWMDQQAFIGYNYYRIHGISKDERSIYTQVIKVLKSKTEKSIQVYPNPVIDGNINLLLTNQPAGIYGIRLLNPLGQVIVSKSILHTGGDRMEKIRNSAQNVTKGVYQLEVSKPDGYVEVIKLIE